MIENDYACRPLDHSNEAEFMAATLLIESKVQSMQTWGSKKIIYANLGFYFGFRFPAMKVRLSYCIAMGSFTREI